MAYYDCDETDRAVAAYLRWAERQGYIVDQPNRYETRRDGDAIIIANCNGELARYRVTAKGGVRRVAA